MPRPKKEVMRKKIVDEDFGSLGFHHVYNEPLHDCYNIEIRKAGGTDSDWEYLIKRLEAIRQDCVRNNIHFNSCGEFKIDSRLVSVHEAKQYLGIGINAVYELLRTGEMPYTKIGNKKFINVCDLNAYIENHTVEKCPVVVKRKVVRRNKAK